MRRNIWRFLKDLRLFVRAWVGFWSKKFYGWFFRFEKIKDVVAQGLYRQRGRFTRPFVHTAMGGLVAMAVTLAPVLANSIPGTSDTVVEEQLPVIDVMAQSEEETETRVSDKVRDKVFEYNVLKGDTISGIAVKFGVSTETILWENGLAAKSALKPGQIVKVLPVTGIRHKVGRGETIYSIAKKYDANPQAIVDFPFNTFADNETFSLAVGQELIVPDGKKPNEVQWSPQPSYTAQKTPDAGAVSSTGTYVWPIGGRITQRFAWYHRGVDIATAHGTPVVAADSGRVRVAGWPDNSGYGMRVVLDHGNGVETWYAHLSKVSVSVGQAVNRGDLIGLEGSTGRSTGPHLHFEVRKNGSHLNPLNFLK